MDKTLGRLLSDVIGDKLVAYDPTPAIERAFASTSPKSPLKLLAESDRRYVWSFLLMYEVMSKSKGLEPADQLGKLLADTEKLAERLQSELFEGEYAESLVSFTAGFEDLPLRLAAFSSRLGKALDSGGKRGHKGKTSANQILVEVSEFVRMRIGQHYDEDLAELFQAVASGIRPMSEDMSGDAIRKKREYMAKSYPVLFANASKSARKACERLDETVALQRCEAEFVAAFPK